MLSRLWIIISLGSQLLGSVQGKWIEGYLDTKDNWAFLSRFCFLSFDGQFEYLIEFETEMGTPNLLLYYDDDSQWPSVYHTDKSCKEKEAVLNKAGQNQIITLSHWYPDTEFSGCILRNEDQELPATISSTTTKAPPTSSTTTKSTTTRKKIKKTTEMPGYFDQFLKTSSTTVKTTLKTAITDWVRVTPTDLNFTDFENITADVESFQSNFTVYPVNIRASTENSLKNDSKYNKLDDVEYLFENNDQSKRLRIKRSPSQLLEQLKRRQMFADPKNEGGRGSGKQRYIVSCHNARRFRSARERWWFIAISNCDSRVGLKLKYKFLMTNGPDGDFWHEHFSADEFYVLPVLMAYTMAYGVVLMAVVMCSVELKSRRLLHATYKLFAVSVLAEQAGILVNAMAYARLANTGVFPYPVHVIGQFMCAVSEMLYLLLLVLMAKGYTITRARLKVSFTVKLTVFMCGYTVTYVALFIYQAKAFDPGEVLYLYESPPGYALIVLRLLAWAVFAYAVLFTVRKYPEKNNFYCPFSICGTLWFYAGPLFILVANSYVDKWVRESVVTAVLLLITFAGHCTFLLLTLPVFANKNFPYHVRTTQIGVMEVAGGAGGAGGSCLDRFANSLYQPSDPQTVIIPLTRRTEELIGNIYNQYMATTPIEEVNKPTTNGALKMGTNHSPRGTLIQQESTETNKSEEIKPNIPKTSAPVQSVENIFRSQRPDTDKINQNGTNDIRKTLTNGSLKTRSDAMDIPDHITRELHQNGGTERENNQDLSINSVGSDKSIKKAEDPEKERFAKRPAGPDLDNTDEMLDNCIKEIAKPIMSITAKRKIKLEPLNENNAAVPSWSLAKGPEAMKMNSENDTGSLPPIRPSSFRKVPPPRSGSGQAGEISTIHENYVQTFSRQTEDLFAATTAK